MKNVVGPLYHSFPQPIVVFFISFCVILYSVDRVYHSNYTIYSYISLSCSSSRKANFQWQRQTVAMAIFNMLMLDVLRIRLLLLYSFPFLQKYPVITNRHIKLIYKLPDWKKNVTEYASLAKHNAALSDVTLMRLTSCLLIWKKSHMADCPTSTR